MKAERVTVADRGYGSTIPGVTRTEGGVHICVTAPGQECSLILYEKGKKKGRRIPFSPKRRIGNVWFLDLEAEDFSDLEYTLEVDGVEYPDLCGREYGGRERWGDEKAAGQLPHSRFPEADYDWEGDAPPRQPFEDMILYRLHVRGFTRHASSQVQNRGTFGAVAEKIPYMKELGVTAVELMPVNEFQEVMMEPAAGAPGGQGNHGSQEPSGGMRPTGRLNYWGYGESWLFAPKAAYGAGKGSSPAREFKDLVKALHRSGIEVIIELYFTGRESASLVQAAVRFWVSEYHVDGVHLVGFARTGLLASDPMLADTKLLAVSWDEADTALQPWHGLGSSLLSGRPKAETDASLVRPYRRLAEYNDGFLTDMRRLLKGDEGQLNALIFRTSRNPRGYGVINYMAGTNGFTMMDMVSYDQKHNEANGEDNRDGSDCNYSWNCGVEGPSRKKKVVLMRRQQLRNAYALLLLSQGTPLILAGDEFGRTKGGNNNSYCQDNETSWLNWNLLKTNESLFQFVKGMIAFRKKHPVFHRPEEPKNTDYLVCGHPDVSYHGVNAWCPEFESFRRQLGILYCGAYGMRADGTPDDYFFVAYNMHWEPHAFALPNLPKGMQWHLAVNTADHEVNGIYPEGREPALEDQKNHRLPARSIVVFIGLKTEGKERRTEKTGKTAEAQE